MKPRPSPLAMINQMSSNAVREIFEKYPMWLFYWWSFYSKHKSSLKEFRKTIVFDEFIAKMNNRALSSKPIQEMGKIIDKYKTWK